MRNICGLLMKIDLFLFIANRERRKEVEQNGSRNDFVLLLIFKLKYNKITNGIPTSSDMVSY